MILYLYSLRSDHIQVQLTLVTMNGYKNFFCCHENFKIYSLAAFKYVMQYY